MRATVPLAVALLLLAAPAQANEVYLGTITATSSVAKNQTSTASAFVIPQGQRIVIDCVDGSGNAANAYLAFMSSTSGAVTSSNYVRMTSFWESVNGGTYQYLSVLGVSGTVNCHVSAVY